MDDCVAAVTVAVAAYRRRKLRIKNINQLALVLGLLDEEDVIVSRELICSLCNVRRAAVTFRLLDAVGGRLRSTVCMAPCDLRTAFVWLCKSETIEHHVPYHATIVSRSTSKAMGLPAAALRAVVWVTAL